MQKSDMFRDQCRLSIRGIMDAHHGQTGRGQREVTCLTNPLKTPPKDTVQHPVGQTKKKKQMRKSRGRQLGGTVTRVSI